MIYKLFDKNAGGTSIHADTQTQPVMLSRVPILTMVRKKYKKIFAKGYTPNWFEEVFVIKKVKNAVPWTQVISGLNGEEVVGAF